MNEIQNSARFIGRLTDEGKLTYLKSGTAKITFSLAVGRRRKVNDEWTDDVIYPDLYLFGASAENFARFTKKGTSIAVEAEYQRDRVETEQGVKYYHWFFVRDWKILADGLGRDEANEVETYNDDEFPF